MQQGGRTLGRGKIRNRGDLARAVFFPQRLGQFLRVRAQDGDLVNRAERKIGGGQPFGEGGRVADGGLQEGASMSSAILRKSGRSP